MCRTYLAIAFSALLTACAGMTPRITPATDDHSVTVRVRTALLNDPVVHGHEINVAAQNGVVVLRGQVHGQQEADAAIAIARRVEGVKDVQSELLTDK